MNNTVHQYDKFSNIHNFFFHPLHRQKEHKTKSILSVVTNIALTIITGGLWLIPFGIVNRLDHKKLKILNEGASGVSNASSTVFPGKKKSKTTATGTTSATETSSLNLKREDAIFGKEDWLLFGDVGNVPEIPPELNVLLDSDCKIFPGKKVWETHILTLIPEELNDGPITIGGLSDKVSTPSDNKHPSKYVTTSDGYLCQERNLNDNTRLQTIPAHWVLITRDVVANTRGKTYDAQAEIIRQTAERTHVAYTVPSTRDVVFSLFMHHAKTGEKLHANNFTRCMEKGLANEQVLVGDFTDEGLLIRTRAPDTEIGSDGMVAALVIS